jgi:hypothetical protein
MSISSTGLFGSATIVNSDLINDVEDLKEQVTTLTTSHQLLLKTPRRYITNKLDVSSNLSKNDDSSNNRITNIEDDITYLSYNRITDIEDDITDLSNDRITHIEDDITGLSNNRR